MNLAFPSLAFDEAVAALCHGQATDEQVRGLHDLLRRDPAARDGYLLRVELHSRLASEPDLFAGVVANPVVAVARDVFPVEPVPERRGGFVPRPIRPSRNWKGDNFLGKDPASTQVRHRPVDAAVHARFSAAIKSIPPQQR